MPWSFTVSSFLIRLGFHLRGISSLRLHTRKILNEPIHLTISRINGQILLTLIGICGTRFSVFSYHICCSIQQRRKTKASNCKILYFYFFSEVQGFRWHCEFFQRWPPFLETWPSTKQRSRFSECVGNKIHFEWKKNETQHFLTAETFFWLLQHHSKFHLVGDSRRFRSLKLLFVMRSYGAQGLISDYIRKQIKLAEIFYQILSVDDRFLFLPQWDLCASDSMYNTYKIQNITYYGFLYSLIFVIY